MNNLHTTIQDAIRQAVELAAIYQLHLDEAEAKCELAYANVMYFERRYELEPTEQIGQHLDRTYNTYEKVYNRKMGYEVPLDGITQATTLLQEALSILREVKELKD